MAKLKAQVQNTKNMHSDLRSQFPVAELHCCHPARAEAATVWDRER